MTNPLNGKTWPVLVAIGGLLVALVIWVQSSAPAAITFGDDSASYLKSFSDMADGRPSTIPTIAPGEKFKLCFDALVWYRIARSEADMWFIDAKGRRHDIPSSVSIGHRIIPLPPSAGAQPKKCRPEMMPDLGMPAGPSILTGVFISADSFLWRTRIVTLSYPQMAFILSTSR